MKRLFTLAIILLSTFALSAQHFDIRAYGGFSILQTSDDEGEKLIDGVTHQRNVSGRPGAQFGAALTFGDRFYVQPGIQISSFGTEVINTADSVGSEFNDQTTIQMISVPLKVGFRLINPEDENMINVRIFGGFDGHHVLSVTHSQEVEDDITEDDYNNLIVNADFGMGVDIAFLFVDLGYQIGLTPFYSDNSDTRANSFYGNIGVRIAF